MQDHSVQALQHRGVKFLSCHTATEEQALAMVKKFSLPSTPEQVVKDLQAHVLPGVLIVPAMVATVALLQSEGRFTYITV
jgi:intracellular sulfur oxidation DsrE/DsrF family protein